ncbi:hypothetical protein [Stenotrophomonas phage RAS14]
MHICPQEIMAVVGLVEHARPLMGLVKMWCESCFNGTHKNCEDHAADVTASKAEPANG